MGQVKKKFEGCNVLKSQDCLLRIPYLIPMKNDPSSLMDDLALLGSFGGFHQPESNGNICSSPTTMTVTIERRHNFDKNRQKLPFHPPPT